MTAPSLSRFAVLSCASLTVAMTACAGSSSGAAGFNDGGGVDAGRDGQSSGDGAATAGSGGAPGVGGASAGSGGALGTGGASATGGSAAGSGGTSGGSGGNPGCVVDLSLVPPQTEGNLVSGLTARVNMRADLSAAGGQPPRWTWTVEYLQTAQPRPIDAQWATDASMPTVSTAVFPVLDPGHYRVSATADSGLVCSRSKVIVVNPPGPAAYTFRVTPPASLNLDVPVQDIQLTASAGTHDIGLMRGTRRSFAAQAPDGRFIPSYVRVGILPGGAVAEGYTGRGPFDIFSLPGATYQVLIVPDGDYAPMRMSTSWPSQVADNTYNPLRMNQGLVVRGALRSSDGSAVIGARILLRDGDLPSTLGISDGVGAFSLWARPGVVSAAVVPPASAGLPEALVSGAPGIALDASVSDLTLTWAPVVRGALSAVVNDESGNPVPGARVRIEPEPGEDHVVATLRITGAQITTVSATGAARADAVSDDTGAAAFGLVPEGAYKITVVPPSDRPNAALATAHVRLTQTGLIQTVSLAPHLHLSGTLLPRGKTAGVRVVARDQSTGLAAPVAAAVADGQGAYVLSVDPDRMYQLTAEPPVGSGLARTVLETKGPIFTDAVARDYTVSPAIAFDGLVRVEGSARTVGGAVIQIFCIDQALNCSDPDVAIAESVTDDSGVFTAALPAAATGP